MASGVVVGGHDVCLDAVLASLARPSIVSFGLGVSLLVELAVILPAVTRINPGHTIQASGTFLGALKGWLIFDLICIRNMCIIS